MMLGRHIPARTRGLGETGYVHLSSSTQHVEDFGEEGFLQIPLNFFATVPMGDTLSYSIACPYPEGNWT